MKNKKYGLLKRIAILSFLCFSTSLFCVTVLTVPNPTTAGTQRVFDVSVNINDFCDIRGYKIIVHYNYNIIDFSQAVHGDLFENQPIGWWIVDDEIPGVVKVECLIFGAGLFVTGPGNILKLKFSGLTEDITNLVFHEIELYDPVGLIIPNVDSINGCIIIGGEPAYISAKCFLEGPYYNGNMNTDINYILPLTSPYRQDPVNVDYIPPDVVDWVLVELRETYNGSAIKFQSVFLYDDGTIKSIGMPCIIFMNTDAIDYFTVIYHRNHLSIMSSIAVNFKDNGDPTFHDFTNELHVYGNGGIKELESGVFGMIAGDANQDGNVFPDDLNNVWRLEVGQNGYLEGDFNLDGNVFPDDRNDFWRINTGMSSTVP